MADTLEDSLIRLSNFIEYGISPHHGIYRDYDKKVLDALVEIVREKIEGRQEQDG